MPCCPMSLPTYGRPIRRGNSPQALSVACGSGALIVGSRRAQQAEVGPLKPGLFSELSGRPSSRHRHPKIWPQRQHFLYLMPLPQGHGSLRPYFLGASALSIVLIALPNGEEGFMSLVNSSISGDRSQGKLSVIPNWISPLSPTDTPYQCAAR